MYTKENREQLFKEIKFRIASIQFDKLQMNSDKTAIEANASTHAIAEFVTDLLISSEDWISVRNRLPNKGEKVIGYFPHKNEGGYFVDTAYNFDDKNVVSDFPNSTAFYFKASHWMKLPEAPTNRYL